MPGIDDEARTKDAERVLDVAAKCLLGSALIAIAVMAALEWALA